MSKKDKPQKFGRFESFWKFVCLDDGGPRMSTVVRTFLNVEYNRTLSRKQFIEYEKNRIERIEFRKKHPFLTQVETTPMVSVKKTKSVLSLFFQWPWRHIKPTDPS